MHRLLDLIYGVALLLLLPWLWLRRLRTGRYREGVGDRLWGLSRPVAGQPVWFHGVSLGEIHLLRQLVRAFRQRHPEQPCIVSTTTNTGFEEARRCFPDLEVIRFPFDFSWAVRRTLDQVRPSLIVLAESELWPNFLLAVRQRHVPLALVNARMSPRSLGRYRLLAPLAGWVFRSFDLVAAQSEEYAAAFLSLGAFPGRVQWTGSVKYDGARTERDNPETAALRQLLQVEAGDLVWVAGSTQAPEEALTLEVYQQARRRHPNLRLVLVPRSPDRFAEVAGLIERAGLEYARRSGLRGGEEKVLPLVLLDTVGELGALWGLADLAFVGGSLDGKRGGQNMIEPAGFGAAVVFGPHVWNFKEPARLLEECGGAWRVQDGADLERTVLRLLADAGERQAMGESARAFVLGQQGATRRTLDLLDRVLPGGPPVVSSFTGGLTSRRSPGGVSVTRPLRSSSDTGDR